MRRDKVGFIEANVAFALKRKDIGDKVRAGNHGAAVTVIFKEVPMTAHEFHPSILREYDVRGVVGKTLSTYDALALGRSFGTVVKRRGGGTIAVGYDGRISSPDMAAQVIEGILSTGVDVVSIGLGPTPMLYYAVKELHTSAGVMITGSHNPSEYNGFKMLHDSGPVYGEAILELGQISKAGDHEKGEGRLRHEDVRDRYVERLLKDYTGERELHVAWDCGNGAAGEVLNLLLAKLPGEHEVIYDTIDGNFPHHHPDPTFAREPARSAKTCGRYRGRSGHCPSMAMPTALALWTGRDASSGAISCWRSMLAKCCKPIPALPSSVK